MPCAIVSRDSRLHRLEVHGTTFLVSLSHRELSVRLPGTAARNGTPAEPAHTRSCAAAAPAGPSCSAFGAALHRLALDAGLPAVFFDGTETPGVGVAPAVR